jgi:hypothetical protein
LNLKKTSFSNLKDKLSNKEKIKDFSKLILLIKENSKFSNLISLSKGNQGFPNLISLK